jgi:predicted permease
MSANGLSRVARLYRVLLLCFPADFRREYGDEAARVFGELHAEVCTAGPAAIALLWCRALLSSARHGLAERLDSRRGIAAQRQLDPARRAHTMDVIRQDLIFALRLLRKERAYATAVVLTLGLCLGANAAIFAVVQAVLLRPLSYPEADRLLFTYESFPGAGIERAGSSVPNHLDRQKMKGTFESVALYRFRGIDIGEAGKAEHVESGEVTASLFHTLRARAFRGRLFADKDNETGHEQVAILSHGFWQRQFAGADVVGRAVRLNGRVFTIVGVMPENFVFLSPNVSVWLPLTFSAEERSEESRWSQNHDAVARLADAVTVAQAQSQIDAMTARIIEQAGPLKETLKNAGYRIVLAPLSADVVRNVKAVLNLLWGGALFVLLIAAVNVTNLALVRMGGRMKELATRHAIGAARGRVARQLLTETVLLTTLGGVLGLAIGAWALSAVTTLGMTDLPRGQEVRMDGMVIGLTFGLAVLLGLIIGAVPALQLSGLNLTRVLREDGRTGTAGRGARQTRRVLVVAQVALAFVLLVGAGLLLASFQKILGVNPGFTAEHVLSARMVLPRARYADDAALRSFAARALPAIRALPGVEMAGFTDSLPLSGDYTSSVILAEGHTMAPGESVLSPNQLHASPGFFEAMRVPLKRGRLFSASDAAGAPRVVIVDDTLARKFWPNQDPIGRRMYLPSRAEDVLKPGPGVTWLQVVGVVGTVKLNALTEQASDHVGAYYFPYEQDPQRGIGLAVRTAGDPASLTATVRRTLTAVDPELALFDVAAMPQRVERSLERRRTPMLLATSFAIVALLLASVGIYGVLAYQVSQRTREIGIRMALGSDPTSVLRLVLREGIGLVAVGLLIGMVGALALKRAIASELFGVTALDPVVILSVVGLLALASLVACLGPARRAASVNPVVALSQQ